MGRRDRYKYNQNIVAGYHPVISILEHSPENIKEIWIASERGSQRREEVVKRASHMKIPIRLKKRHEIEEIAWGVNHQGVVCIVKGFNYVSVDEMAERSLRRGSNGLILVADHITDEGNLGAILRTGSFFGVDGIIIPKDRSAGMTSNVIRRSSGAWISVPVSRVVNLARTIEYLNQKGFWIIGTDERATTTIYEFDWRRAIVLIIGSEQKGMSRSLRNMCHEMVKIPSIGYPESLNVSVATGVILSEITRQRQ